MPAMIAGEDGKSVQSHCTVRVGMQTDPIEWNSTHHLATIDSNGMLPMDLPEKLGAKERAGAGACVSLNPCVQKGLRL